MYGYSLEQELDLEFVCKVSLTITGRFSNGYIRTLGRFHALRQCRSRLILGNDMRHVTQEGGGYARIPSGMKTAHGQNLIETALHS